MPEETIRTGIYKHSGKGTLYFVVGLINDKDNDGKSVFYFPLYEESNGCHRSVENFFLKSELFGKNGQRFSLVLELHKDDINHFFPGSVVYIPEEHIVLSTFEEYGKVLVDLGSYEGKEVTLSLDEYTRNWIRLPKDYIAD